MHYKLMLYFTKTVQIVGMYVAAAANSMRIMNANTVHWEQQSDTRMYISN
jgi:hypothetical protein